MKRRSGILMHITSLPSACGVGDLGPEAVRFAEFLSRAKQSVWQTLPIGPTAPFLGDSPYSSYSAFAGHTLMISPEVLLEDGLITADELAAQKMPATSRADFSAVTKTRAALLRTVFEREKSGLAVDSDFHQFLAHNGHWLNDMALFVAAKDSQRDEPWWRWPQDLRDRRPEALERWGIELADDILFHKYCQHLFFSQWGRLRKRLKGMGISLMGDVPIYVTHDSPDVWCNRHLFKLDAEGDADKVAGVPPDYFSITGQRWGNPVFDWDACRAEGFGWWISRLRHNLGLFKEIRLDHFRGFAAYWEIDAAETTAVNGHWVMAPGTELLETLRADHGSLPIIAEDLGVITKDVAELKQRFGLPGMHVLQFGFHAGSALDANAPHNHTPTGVVYTGTHDNNTAKGWFVDELDRVGKVTLGRFAGRTVTEKDAHWELIRLAQASVCATAMIPAQDLIGLGSQGRMNVPGVAGGNWSWRLEPGVLTDDIADRLAELTTFFGRDGSEPIWPTYEDLEREE